MNNNVLIEEYISSTGEKEYFATVNEQYYKNIFENNTIAYNSIVPTGVGKSQILAVMDLKHQLERMIKDVDNFCNELTLALRYKVLDPDDDYMDEKYGE